MNYTKNNSNVPPTLHDLLHRQVVTQGTAPYCWHKLKGEYRSVTFEQFYIDISRVVTLLERRSIRQKNCMIFAENSYWWMVYYMALAGYGGRVICAGAQWVSTELRHAIELTEPDVVLVDDSHREVLDAAGWRGVTYSLEEPEDDDVSDCAIYAAPAEYHSIIVFSTGSTALQKAVPISYAMMMDNSTALNRRCGARRHDRVLLFLPMHHIYAQADVFLAAIYAGCQVYLTDARGFKQDSIDARPTIIPGVPIVYERIVQAIPLDMRARIDRLLRILDSVSAPMWLRRRIFFALHKKLGGAVRYASSGAAPLSLETKQLLNGMGLRLIEGYGMTEACGVVATEVVAEKITDTVGVPLDNIEARIDADNDELLVRGKNISPGRYCRGEIIYDVLDADGWYRTGDRACIDEMGRLRILGRLPGVFVCSNGEKISLQPLKEALRVCGKVQRIILRQDGRIVCAMVWTSIAREEVERIVRAVNKQTEARKRVDAVEVYDIQEGGMK